MTGRVATIHFALLLLTVFLGASAGATVLWDNGSLVNCTGCAPDGADESQLQDTNLSMTSLGFSNSVADFNHIADDFTILEDVWDITRITVFAYQPTSTPATTFTDFRFIIYSTCIDCRASEVAFGDLDINRFSGSDWTNTYRTNQTALAGNTDRPVMRVFAELEPGTLLLPPGSYWIVWQTGGNGALSGPLVPPVTINGEKSTGNALQYSSAFGVWLDLIDSGTGASQGLPFVIEGSKVANFNFGTGIVNIPVVTIDGSPKRYQVEMERTPGTLDFTVIDSNKLP